MAGEEDLVGRLGKTLDKSFIQAARGLHQFRSKKASSRPAAALESSTVLGAWGSLADSVAVFAAGAMGIPGAAAASSVIKALIGVQEAQVVMLTRIQRDVQLLRTGPFRAAREQLDIALRKGPGDAEYAHHLREADDLLVLALGQSASAEESSIIRFNLGLVAAVRGDVTEARHRLRESYRDCVEVTDDLISRTTDVKVFKNRNTARFAARQAAEQLAAVLAAGPRRLVVLDDVWSEEQLAAFPVGGRCARLVTTLNPSLARGASVPVKVDQMSETQARALLSAGLPSLPATVAAGLLEETGRWPLLLRLVNKILADQAQLQPDVAAAAEDVLSRLRRGGALQVDQLTGATGQQLDVSDPDQRQRAVGATIQASTSLLTEAEHDRFAELAIYRRGSAPQPARSARPWSRPRPRRAGFRIRIGRRSAVGPCA